MTYVQGFLIPVPDGKQTAYRDMAQAAAPFFLEHGGTRVVEAWGDDVPDGQRTDLKRAVQAAAGEGVVFSWIEYPDKAACDAAATAMESDERMKPPADMPFDGARMIYSGFEKALDTGFETGSGPLGYIDGFVAAVPTANRDAYVAHATEAAIAFRRLGATRLVETWGVDVIDGKVTDFKRAVAAQPDETVVFSWIEWPDKATRDAGMAAMQDDPVFRDMQMPFDPSRMIFGGFTPMVDAGQQEA